MKNQQGTIFGATDGKIVTSDLPYLQEVAQTGEDRLGELDGLLKLFHLPEIKREILESWLFELKYDDNEKALFIRVSRVGTYGCWENRLDFFPDHVQSTLNSAFCLYLQTDYRGYAVAGNISIPNQHLEICHAMCRNLGWKATTIYGPRPNPDFPGQIHLAALRVHARVVRPESPEVIQRRTKQAARKLLKQLGVKPQRAPRQRP